MSEGKIRREILRGCDCCKKHDQPQGNSPIAYLIERFGAEMAVCTKCYHPEIDNLVSILAGPDQDPDPFFSHDGEGAIILTLQFELGMHANPELLKKYNAHVRMKYQQGPDRLM